MCDTSTAPRLPTEEPGPALPGCPGWLWLAGPDGASSCHMLPINLLLQPLGSAAAGGAGGHWGDVGGLGESEHQAGGTLGWGSQETPVWGDTGVARPGDAGLERTSGWGSEGTLGWGSQGWWNNRPGEGGIHGSGNWGRARGWGHQGTPGWPGPVHTGQRPRHAYPQGPGARSVPGDAAGIGDSWRRGCGRGGYGGRARTKSAGRGAPGEAGREKAGPGA